MTTIYTTTVNVSNLPRDWEDQVLAEFAATIDAHCIVQNRRMEAVGFGIKMLKVTFRAENDVEAAAITRDAAKALPTWAAYDTLRLRTWNRTIRYIPVTPDHGLAVR